MKTEDLPKLKKRIEAYKGKLGLEGDLRPGSMIMAAKSINKPNNKINKNGRTSK